MKTEFFESAFFNVTIAVIIGFVFGVAVAHLISLEGINLKVDDKIKVEQKTYRVSDIKVIDTKNIVLNVYKIGENKWKNIKLTGKQ